MRQPITRASSGDSSMFMVAFPRSPHAYAIRRRVAVGDDPLAQRGLADLLTPALREAQEEQLLAAEAASRRCRLALERPPPGVVGDRQARDIGDVLTQRLFAVHGDVGEGPVSVELCDQTRARCLAVREVTLGPPVLQPPAGIEQRSLVIETVADLVSDGGAGRAVIHGGIP